VASTGRDCAVNPPFILLASTQSVTIKLAQCMSVIYIGYMSDIFSKKYRIFSAFVKICHIFHNKVISYNLHVFSKKNYKCSCIEKLIGRFHFSVHLCKPVHAYIVYIYIISILCFFILHIISFETI